MGKLRVLLNWVWCCLSLKTLPSHRWSEAKRAQANREQAGGQTRMNNEIAKTVGAFDDDEVGLPGL